VTDTEERSRTVNTFGQILGPIDSLTRRLAPGLRLRVRHRQKQVTVLHVATTFDAPLEPLPMAPLQA
jgi:hypothetical protein